MINEFMAQPHFDWNGDGKIDSGDQYIELINLSDEAISLYGWGLDDQPGDSSLYRIGDVTIQPKAHLVFFSAKTHILLSAGGDTVRLFKSNGLVSDAFSYAFIPVPDQTWCRYPDGGSVWMFGCIPSEGEINQVAPPVVIGKAVQSAACSANKLPPGIQTAECDSFGLSAWDANLWLVPPGFPRFYEKGKDVYIFD